MGSVHHGGRPEAIRRRPGASGAAARGGPSGDARSGLRGKGKIGNDVFGIFDKDFPTDLPQRVQDIDQAKSLLKSAGQENLVIQLVTTPNAPGMIPAAQVFATQAKKAGVTVNIVQQTTTDYFANSYLKVRVQPGLLAHSAVPAGRGPGARRAGRPVQRHHFNDPEYNSLYAQATAELDAGKRADLIHQLAHLDYDRGANIIPYFFPTVDADQAGCRRCQRVGNRLQPRWQRLRQLLDRLGPWATRVDRQIPN